MSGRRRIAGTDDPTQPMSSLAGFYERQPLVSTPRARGGGWGVVRGDWSTPFGRDRLWAFTKSRQDGTVVPPPPSGACHDTDQLDFVPFDADNHYYEALGVYPPRAATAPSSNG